MLIRNPEINNNNSYTKPNYFIDELYNEYEEYATNLNPEEDFSVFFPLPFNKEQKQIYENYLKNRLTVVTGPPGTGKSHTIVNILCSLLAQGKRVLVTAQTDKALESLLNKIPEKFDDLIFTKIQLENNKNRFSLEKSIGNITKILTEDFYLNIENKIKSLNKFKAQYVKIKSNILEIINKEYEIFNDGEYFKGLRNYQIYEKFEKKNQIEWNWIKDKISLEFINQFDQIKEYIIIYKKYYESNSNQVNYSNIDFEKIIIELIDIDFKYFLKLKSEITDLYEYLQINETQKEKLIKIDFDYIHESFKIYTNSDIVINKIQELEELISIIKPLEIENENIVSNKSFLEFTENEFKYLSDIETYVSFIKPDKKQVSFITKINTKFKKVIYLEDITINGFKCNTKTNIFKLKNFLLKLYIINKGFNYLIGKGYKITIDEKANLNEKIILLNETLSKVLKNKELISKLQNDENIINFSKIVNQDRFDIEGIVQKVITYKDEFRILQNKENELKYILLKIKNINDELNKLNKNHSLHKLLPIESINNILKYAELKNQIERIYRDIENIKKFKNAKHELEKIITNSLPNLNKVSIEYITKENFEFAFINYKLLEYDNLDLQQKKEELSNLTNRIFDEKCNILFDLAKNNFRNNFDKEEINIFINLLEQFKSNLIQSQRNIRNKVQFQILTRKNSIDISKKLSCWVMKFNDVLNSVGCEPEIFDCIIVDEASQLDFNSLLLGYYAENMIIVGDDKQTSPNSLTGADGDDFESIKNQYLGFLGENKIQIRSDNSLFTLSKMIAGQSNLALIEHFRCVPELIEFSKHNFYNDELKPLKQINTNRLEPKKAIYIEESFTENKIVYNEVETIKKYLHNILKNPYYKDKTIGVVSLGLVKHTEKLKDIKEELINDFGKEKIDKHKLIIDDSPKFQGDERDIMLVSLGVGRDLEKFKKNENSMPRAIITDQDEFKKINVALSRAKEQMILFHSVKISDLSERDFRLKILNFFYAEIIPLSPFILPYSNDARTPFNVPSPFDSWFEFDIAKELIKTGFNYIQPQYKVKEDESFYNHKLNIYTRVNFKIDIVVHNNNKLVAIECDGDPFHSLPEDVAYDVERQEFLERVGWKVYRILYSSFKRNPSKEIEKMKNFIEINTIKDEIIPFQNSSEEIIINNEIEKSFTEDNKTNNGTIVYELFDFKENEFNDNPLKDNHNILRFFNLYENGTYTLDNLSNPNSVHSIPIKENHKHGFLLQCYDNGHINKVYVETLLNKRINHIYSNGVNPNAKLLYLKVIEKELLIATKYSLDNEIIFKAHFTEKISTRESLNLQGYKVMYHDFDNIEFKILPLDIFSDIKRLVYESFNAIGKPTNNNYYINEWNILKKFIPNLMD